GKGPFCALNCAAIPESLLESELFGHEKGAFTGAVRQTRGQLELAQGGSVFLDEIGEMSPMLQAKLLRVLQERKIQRVGGRQPIELDVRFICATHQDLHAMMEQKRFREDLYYRISEVSVTVPPLRERDGDAVLLARYFLDASSRRHRRHVRGLSADAIEAIQAYPWPGNVRELENRVNSAVIMSEGSLLTAADLGFGALTGSETLNLRELRRKTERSALDRALAVAGGNYARAAQLLGVTRPTLYDLIARHRIPAAGRGAVRSTR
ncbi:MAG: sigma 54-interacting transcriptional regulator, partial [Steroidobacteraceae bacterium]|nr:sigma 54-interacting transcriptional regulator [Steroidobacteraceae bacterium]